MPVYTASETDHAYVTDPNDNQKYNIFYPTGPTPLGGWPFVIWFNITGFVGSSRVAVLDGSSGLKPYKLAERYLAAGFAVICASLTINTGTVNVDPADPRCWYPPTVGLTEPFHLGGFDFAETDALLCVQEVVERALAEEIPLNPNQCGVMGGSSGADCALHAALSRDWVGTGAKFSAKTTSTRPSGFCVAVEPQTWWRAFNVAYTTGLPQVGHFEASDTGSPNYTPTPATDVGQVPSSHADQASAVVYGFRDAVYPGISALNCTMPVYLANVEPPDFTTGFGTPGVYTGANGYGTDFLTGTFHSPWHTELLKRCFDAVVVAAIAPSHKCRYGVLEHAQGYSEDAVFSSTDALLDDIITWSRQQVGAAMGYSHVTYFAVSGTQAYTIPFEFLSSAYVSATVDGSATGVVFTISADGNTITFSAPTFTGGETLYISRETPKGDTEQIVDFTDGSRLTEDDLERSRTQLLHISQEGYDLSVRSLFKDNLTHFQWEAAGLQLKNLGEPTEDNDSVRLVDLQNAVIASGTLPTVTSAQNNYMLLVQAGAFALAAPATVRNALGLGTAAVLDTGTAAGTIPLLDANGYPALSGVNIDLSTNAVGTSITNLQGRMTSAEADIVALEEMQGQQVSYWTDQALIVDLTGTWQQVAGNRLTGSAVTEYDPLANISANAPNKSVQLAAGTWEVEISGRVRNSGGGAYTARFNLTDEVSSGSTLVHMAVPDWSVPAGHVVSFAHKTILTFASGDQICVRMACGTAAGTLACEGVTMYVRRLN